MKRKNIFYLLPLFLIAVFLFSACSKQVNTVNLKDNEEKLNIASSIYPLYSIVNFIGGERISNHLILPAGSSPHTYDVSPQDIKKLEGARVVFSIGAGSDMWLQEIMNSFSEMENFSLENSVNLQAFAGEHAHKEHEAEHEEHEAEHEEHNHNIGDVDPHYWLSPENSKLIAEAVSMKLSEIDPAGEEVYKANADNFKAEIDSNSFNWQEKISQLNNKEIIVFHEAWSYFANYFNLEIAGSFEPFPGKLPSPQYLQNLQNTIIEHNIKAIFVEPQLSQSAVKVLASDLNIKVEVLDPLGGTNDINSYFDLINYNVDTVYKALKTN